MHLTKVLLLLVFFDGYTSKTVYGFVSSAISHGRSISNLKEFSGPATLPGSARTSSIRSQGGHGHNEAPKNYSFNYQVSDNQGNMHFHKEEAVESGAVEGSYGYTDTRGLYRIVEYTADANGFRANIQTNEPSLVGKKNSADIRMNHQQSASDIRDKYFKSRLMELFAGEALFPVKSLGNEKLPVNIEDTYTSYTATVKGLWNPNNTGYFDYDDK